MPFKSEAQRRWMWANDPEMAREWQAHTPKGKKLPGRKGKKGPTANVTTRKARKQVRNAKAVKVTRLDPSRTLTLRNGLSKELRRRFALLKGRIVKAVVIEDVFGLGAVHNAAEDQPRDEHGRWVGGIGAAISVGKEAVVSRGAKLLAKLPDPLKSAGLLAGKAYFAGYMMGNAAVRAVARERGLNEDQVKKLAIACTTANNILGGTRAAAAMAAAGMPHLAAPAAFVPWGSAAYLAYSTARDPLATLRAAKGAVAKVKGAVGRGLGHLGFSYTHHPTGNAASATLNAEYDDYDAIASFLQENDFGDWATAVLYSALEEGDGVHDAVLTAQEVLQHDPDDPEGLVGNCAPGQLRDEATGWCGPGVGVDIPREQMPQVKPEDLPGLILWLRGQGIGVAHLSATAEDLAPTQAHFRQERVDAIPDDHRQPLIVSSDNYILDGTHRWVKAWQRSPDSVVPVVRVNLPLQEALRVLRNYPRAKFVENTRWQPLRDPEKVKAFQEWLATQFKETLTGADSEELWRKYAEAGFRKGAARAFDDTNASRRAQSALDRDTSQFYEGGRDQFLRSAFSRPVAMERIQLLAGRSFDDLENVTDDLSVRLSRSLADGLVAGQSPRDIARGMVEDLDLSRTRAELIARTEVIRAHADGQLISLKAMGVTQVGVDVEFTVTDDGLLCPECAALEGAVYDIDEASGVIPVHPQCRCAWVPHLPAGLVDTEEPAKGDEEDATENVYGPVVPSGRGRTPAGGRTRSHLGGASFNTFCPTGPGGGVDPTCSPGGAGSPHYAIYEALSSADLAGSQKAKYATAVERVLGRMPPKALEHLHEGLTGVTFHADAHELTDAYERSEGSGSVGDDLVNGFYNHDSGTAHLDGETRKSDAPGLGGSQRNVHGTYAHELTHAIDRHGQFSLSDEWHAAYEHEVRADWSPTSRLTGYARKNATEGFAEFGRAVYGSDVPHDNLRKWFPGCYKFFQSKGLVEDVTSNTFCPTGPGGGVDPTCSPHGLADAVVDAAKNYITRDQSDRKSFARTSEALKNAIGDDPKGDKFVHAVQTARALLKGESPPPPPTSTIVPVESKPSVPEPTIPPPVPVPPPTLPTAEGTTREMTSEDKQAFKDYSTTNFRYANKVARGGKEQLGKRQQAIGQDIHDRLEKAWESVPAITDDLQVHRGLADAHEIGIDVTNPDKHVGTSFVDKGWTSTSSDFGMAHGFANGGTDTSPKYRNGVVFSIRVPKGTKALDMTKTLGKGRLVYGDEKEHVLPKGGKFTITGHHRERGVLVMEAEYAPE